MSVALKDAAACQYVLRILTGKKDLVIKEVRTQYVISNTIAHGARLDVLAECEDGSLYDLELQQKDAVDHKRRTRFYGALIDGEGLQKGKDYTDLPDVHIFYISRNDWQKAGKTIYHIKQYMGETTFPYENGLETVYVNASVDDGSEIARLMKYFKTADPEDMSRGALSKRIHFLKCEEGGYDDMCEVTERFMQIGRDFGFREGKEKGREEGRMEGQLEGRMESKKETAANLAAMGMAVGMIAKAVGENIVLVGQWLETAGQKA